MKGLMYVQLFAAGWRSMSAAHALSAVRLWRTLYRGESNVVILCVRRVCERLSCLASRRLSCLAPGPSRSMLYVCVDEGQLHSI